MMRDKMAAVLWAIALPFFCCADTVVANGVTWVYSISDNKIVIDGIEGMCPTSIAIPSTIDRLPVVRIGPNVFRDNWNVNNVTMPDSITSVGFYSFSGCRALKSISFSSQLQYIENNAFRGCTSLTDIQLPQSLLAIEAWAFDGCTKLATINIPSGVEEIGAGAFHGCSKLGDGMVIIDNCLVAYNGTSPDNISLPNKIRLIAGGVFSENKNLRTIDIPAGVRKIGDNCFDDCSALSSVVLHEGLESIGARSFRNCTNLSSFVMPDSITVVGHRAFEGCSSLANVELSANIVEIESGLFESCTSLTTIELPLRLARIDEEAFYCCSKLTSITIPDGVTEIGVYAFASCSELMSVVIPASVNSIHNNAFKSCSKITSLIVPSHTVCMARDFPDVYDKIQDVKISDGEVRIGTCAFEGCESLTHIDLPETIASIYSGAFRSCKNLVSVELPLNATYISDDTFDGCDKITSVVVPAHSFKMSEVFPSSYKQITELAICKGETSIGEKVFEGCSSLRALEIPQGVTNIGAMAFKDSRELESISIPSSVISIGRDAFSGCELIGGDYVVVDGCLLSGGGLGRQSVNIPVGVRLIADAVFKGDEDVRSVAIPNGVEWIGGWAFCGCKNLDSIVLPRSLKGIGDFAFMDCTNLKTLDFPAELQSIGNGAFEESGIEAVTIPSSVARITDYAFCRCGYLKSVKIEEGVSAIGLSAFFRCYSLEEVIIPSSVKRIGLQAFDDCARIKRVMIPESVQTLKMVFRSSYTTIQDVVLCNGMTKIASSTFAECAGLKSLVIPPSVMEISESAFGSSEWVDIYVSHGDEKRVYKMIWDTGMPTNFQKMKNIPAPVITPPDGFIFESAVKVVITNQLKEAVIHYELGGVEPTIESPVFTKFTATKPETIKAIAEWNGLISPTATAHIGKGQVDSPVITSSKGTRFQDAENVISISCGTDGVEIRYSLDGSMPDGKSKLYNGPFVITDSTVVKAIATGHSELLDSDITTVEFYKEWIKTESPLIVLKNGGTKFNFSGTEVLMSCNDETAKIYYTLDGSEPTENSALYSAPIAIDATTTVKALAVKVGCLASDVSTAQFTREWIKVPRPSITSASGKSDFDAAGELITLVCDMTDAKLYYTLDGSKPSPTNGIEYKEPFTIDDTTVVRVVAVKDDYTNSDVTTMTFTRNWKQVSTPIVKSEYNGVETTKLEGSALCVTMSCETENAVIHYTLDGTLPTRESAVYLCPFLIRESSVVTAVAVRKDWKDSQVVTLCIGKVWTAGDSLNLPDAHFVSDGAADWVTDDEESHDGIASMRSGEIGDDESSVLRLSLDGPGEISFWWKSSCEKSDAPNLLWWDYGSFLIDGKEVAWIDGVMDDWEKCVFRIDGDAPHEVSWKYEKDDSYAEGQDCIWLDCVKWTPKGPVAKPTFDQSDFEFVGSVRYVTVECITEGASIYYTIDGSTPTKESTPYDGRIKITDTTTIKVRAFKDGFDDSEVATMTITKKWTVGDTLNAPDQVFEMPPAKLSLEDSSWKKDIKFSHDGVASLRCGNISHNESTSLRTVVHGKGVVMFWWKASCESDSTGLYRFDHGSFLIDGNVVAQIDGNKDDREWYETEWRLVRVDINADGKHDLVWQYSKDEDDSDGYSCIWVDELTWIPADGSAVTKKNDVPVPYAWLDMYGLLSEHDPETVACQKSGKVDGAGRELTIADEFVAGTNPNDPSSDFKVKIEIIDGKPILSWEPDLNENGTKDLRIYKTYGAKNLGGSDEWTDMDEVSESEKELLNFFKVTVKMPKVDDGNGGGEGGSSSGEGESSQDEGLPKGFSTNGIERVSCTGSEWYDLGLPPTLTMKTEIKWSIAGGDAKRIGIVGVMNSGGSYYMGVAPNGETYQGRVGILDEEIKNGAAYRDTAYEVEFGNCYLKDMVSGRVLKSKTARTGACPTSNIRLFRINYTSLNQFALGSVYYLRIYDVNGLGEYELLRNLVPCKSKVLGVGLLDLVQMRFYKNDGTSVSLVD